MPIYEYKCKDCHSTFTVLQSIWANRKGAKCPDCGSENTERQISRFSAGGGNDSCKSGGAFT
jgi:putative FmdB family regulatory protein